MAEWRGDIEIRQRHMIGGDKMPAFQVLIENGGVLPRKLFSVGDMSRILAPAVQFFQVSLLEQDVRPEPKMLGGPERPFQRLISIIACRKQVGAILLREVNHDCGRLIKPDDTVAKRRNGSVRI